MNALKFEKHVYDGKVSQKARTSAELVSMGTKEIENQVTGKFYLLAQAKVDFGNGNIKEVSCMVYESNYSHEKADWVPGESYLATITVEKGAKAPLITLSHLRSAPRVSFEDAGIDLGELDFDMPTEDSQVTENEEVAEEEVAEDSLGLG